MTVSKFENTSVPMFNATAKKASSLLERCGRVGVAAASAK